MQELENKILGITKKSGEPSMTNGEIRNYIHFVMNEYGKKE